MPNHYRTSNPRSRQKKTKSGCQTCKQRKVKCDETWPVCSRCQSSNRICNGYGVWGGGQSTQECRALSSQPFNIRITEPIQIIPHDDLDDFEWYVQRSAVKLPGAFASEHWQTILFQASTIEPAIRHAVLALGSAHREEVNGMNSEYNNERAILTIRRYTQTIKYLQYCLAFNRKMSPPVVILTCVILVQMEFLRGHYTDGISHLQNGLNMLQDGGLGHSSTYMDGWLITVFTRNFVQARLFGQLQDFPCRRLTSPHLISSTRTFRSIHHARRSLENITLRIFDLQQVHQPGTNEIEQQNQIRRELRIWLSAHEASSTDSDSMLDFFARGILRLHYHIVFVLAGTCLENQEFKFDRYEASFLTIVSRCLDTYNRYLQGGTANRPHHEPEPSSPGSVSDVGWIAPLYFTAIKCRNHRIRRQAIALLETSPHREGIWSATLAAAVAKKVTDLEEGIFYSNISYDKTWQFINLTEEDLATSTLPEELRLSKLHIVLPDDRDGKLLLTCCYSKSGKVVQCEYDLPSRRWRDTGPNQSPLNSLPLNQV